MVRISFLFPALIAAFVNASSQQFSSFQRPNISGGVLIKNNEKNENHQNNNAESIRQGLRSELSDVLSGRRSRKFAKYYGKISTNRSKKRIDGAIVSTHGRNTLTLPEKRNGSTADDNVKKLNMVVYKDKEKQIISMKPNNGELVEPLEMFHSAVVSSPSSFGLAIRAMKLTFYFAPATATSGLAIISSTFRRKIWYRMLRKCLARSGPAFIKWGQWSSTRADMFPEELCKELSNLHADAPSHSWSHTKRTMEEALKISPNSLLSVFESFDKIPIASGSIAQVHRAVLKIKGDRLRSRSSVDAYSVKGKGAMKNGVKDIRNQPRLITVAVKVRHPKVSELINSDFRLMSMIANICDLIPGLSWLKLGSSVEQFSHTMAAQADLSVEANHLEILNYNFRRWKNVGFPCPIFSTPSVIIETFMNGKIASKIMNEYDTIGAASNQPNSHLVCSDVIPLDVSKLMVTNGVALYLQMLLVDNFMHADFHPGNIMVNYAFSFRNQTKNREQSTQVDEASPDERSIHPKNDSKVLQPITLDSTLLSQCGFDGSVYLVDAGMVAELDEDESNNFIGLLAALGEGDGRLAASVVLRFNGMKESNLSYSEKEAFSKDMEKLFKDKCKGYRNNVDFGDVLTGVLTLIRIHRVQITANYATLAVNALCLEGLARRVAPEYNVLDASEPLLRSYHRFIGKNMKKSKIRQALFRASIPFLFLKKQVSDNKFFLDQLKRRRTNMVKVNKINWIGLISCSVCTVGAYILSSGKVSIYTSKTNAERKTFKRSDR